MALNKFIITHGLRIQLPTFLLQLTRYMICMYDNGSKEKSNVDVLQFHRGMLFLNKHSKTVLGFFFLQNEKAKR